MRIRAGRRIVWLSALVLLILSGLGGRVYQLQVAEGDRYARMAFQQRTLSLPLTSRRGQILDRNGVPLTDPRSGWGVAVFPPLVEDQEGERKALAGLLRLPEEAVDLEMADGPSPRWLFTGVSAAVAAEVERTGLPGIAVGAVEERYGPEAMARHLVGYVNSEGGQLGLERALEEELTGEAVPALVAQLDGTGEPMDGLGIRTVLPDAGKPPYTVRTTIDSRLQRAVERTLDSWRTADGRSWRGAVVVMDPKSGDVLAMVSRPQYEYGNLAELIQGGQGSFLLNRGVTDYPPGSVFKSIVAAAALEAGQVAMDEQFHCVGHFDLDGHRFTEASGAHGSITFQQAIAQSCNVTFLKVAHERMGTDALREAALRFGFGQATDALGRDRPWPDEQPGHVPAAEESGAVQMAFGQGTLEVTPLQVARAYAAIANGGLLPPVRLVTALETPAGEVVVRPAAGASVRVMRAETAAALRSALAEVTDPEGSGTGRSAWIPGAGSAGKTGSAEGVDADGAPSVHAWFAGYLPVRNPRYVVTVLAEEGGGGGTAAAPLFRAVGEALLATAGY